jgi:hypothetical protein
MLPSWTGPDQHVAEGEELGSNILRVGQSSLAGQNALWSERNRIQPVATVFSSSITRRPRRSTALPPAASPSTSPSATDRGMSPLAPMPIWVPGANRPPRVDEYALVFQAGQECDFRSIVIGLVIVAMFIAM